MLTGISKWHFESKHIVEPRPLVVVLLHKRKERKQAWKTHCKHFPRTQAQPPKELKLCWVPCPAHPPTHSHHPSSSLQVTTELGSTVAFFQVVTVWELISISILLVQTPCYAWSFIVSKTTWADSEQTQLPQGRGKENPNKDANNRHSTLSLIFRSEYRI